MAAQNNGQWFEAWCRGNEGRRRGSVSNSFYEEIRVHCVCSYDCGADFKMSLVLGVCVVPLVTNKQSDPHLVESLVEPVHVEISRFYAV